MICITMQILPQRVSQSLNSASGIVGSFQALPTDRHVNRRRKIGTYLALFYSFPQCHCLQAYKLNSSARSSLRNHGPWKVKWQPTHWTHVPMGPCCQIQTRVQVRNGNWRFCVIGCLSRIIFGETKKGWHVWVSWHLSESQVPSHLGPLHIKHFSPPAWTHALASRWKMLI